MASVTRPAAHRDEHGRRLTDYPRPSVAVDTAVLTVRPGPAGNLELAVLQVRRPGSGRRGGWALPGTFLYDGETLADAVRRSLAVKAGVTGRAPRQLQVFDDPRRDDRGRVLSVAHLDVLPAAELDALRDLDRTRVQPTGRPGRLPYDHAAIVELAVARMRREYQARPDPWGLLDEPFTVTELRAVHQAVAGHPLQKDTFRRRMRDQLRELPASAAGRVGRPARLQERRAGR